MKSLWSFWTFCIVPQMLKFVLAFVKVVTVGKSLLFSGVHQLPFVLFACCLTMLAQPILPSGSLKHSIFCCIFRRDASFPLPWRTPPDHNPWRSEKQAYFVSPVLFFFLRAYAMRSIETTNRRQIKHFFHLFRNLKTFQATDETLHLDGDVEGRRWIGPLHMKAWIGARMRE